MNFSYVKKYYPRFSMFTLQFWRILYMKLTILRIIVIFDISKYTNLFINF